MIIRDESGISGVVPIELGGTGNSDGYIRTGLSNNVPDILIGKSSTVKGSESLAAGEFSHSEGVCSVALDPKRTFVVKNKQDTISNQDGTFSCTYHLSPYNSYEGYSISSDYSTPKIHTSLTNVKEGVKVVLCDITENDEVTCHPAIVQTVNTDNIDDVTIMFTCEVDIFKNKHTCILTDTDINDNIDTDARAYNRASGYKAYSKGFFSIAEGCNINVYGHYSSSRGMSNFVYGDFSDVCGRDSVSEGSYSHSLGLRCQSSGDYSCASGVNTWATGEGSFAHGADVKAGGKYSHVSGYGGSGGNYTFSHGYKTRASKDYSVALGNNTTAYAESQTVVGSYNVVSTNNSDKFVIGIGTASNVTANCLRVTTTAVYSKGRYNTSGADYAEYFEWLDGNPDNEDRVGRFVTLIGNKISLANSGIDYILGIVSGDPSVVGDVYDDQWKGMYETDIFGRPTWEDVEVSDEYGEHEEVDENGNIVTVKEVTVPAHTEHRLKLNHNYDNNTKYIPRSERPEWDAVGMMGKIIMLDDGSCYVNRYCKPSADGIATYSDKETRFRVIQRIDGNHIQVLVL